MFFKPINKPVTFTPTKKPPLGITPVTVKEGSIYHYGYNDVDLMIYEFDSCQWVGLLEGNQNDVLAHRPQCKYCKARNSTGYVTTLKTSPTLLDSLITQTIIQAKMAEIQSHKNSTRSVYDRSRDNAIRSRSVYEQYAGSTKVYANGKTKHIN